MECDFIGKHDVLRLIRKYFGTNVSQYLTYINQVFKNDTASGELEFKDGFINWWKDNYKEPLDIKTITPVVLKNRIIKYYDYAVPNFSAFEEDNLENNKAMSFGYTSNVARKDAKSFIAHSIYVQYFYNEKKNDSSVPTNNLSKYATNAILSVKVMLAKRLAEETGRDVNEIFNNLKTDNNDYLTSFINDETPITTINLIALYKELSSTKQILKADGTYEKSAQREFFEEVMLSPLLSGIKTTNNDNFFLIDNEILASDISKVESSDSNLDGINMDEFDGTIRDFSLHHGEFSDYKEHIGERIKFLLNTIPKCKSTKKFGKNYDYDLDNSVGLPMYMDGTEISTLLYSYVSRDDKETMLEDIKRLAEAMPGQAGLIRLYDTLMSEPDIANEFFTNFAKHVIPKVQTVVLDGNPIFRQSNSSASRLSMLKQEYTSTYINAIINADIVRLKKAFDFITYTKTGNMPTYNGDKLVGYKGQEMPSILAAIADETGKTPLTDYAVNLLFNGIVQTNKKGETEVIPGLISSFFPTVDRVSFENYVYQSGKTPFETLNAVYSDIKLALNYAETIQVEQKKKDIDIKNAIINNRKKLEENLEHPGTYTKADFEDVEAIIKKQVITPTHLSAPQSFAEHMINFTLVKLNLNSLNVHGNQVSSVLNSSLITRLKAVFESNYNVNAVRKEREKSPLELLAEDYHLDQTTQFKLSNILIEQDGHAGLFRKDKSGKYVPTEYAQDLLSFTLFDGAVNQDTETPVLYNEMSKGDYIGTAWINFFNKEDTNLSGTDFKLGRYFLRIPSDAPKTFIIKAPRYIVNANHQLFRTVNQEKYDNFINSVTNTITNKISDNDFVQAELDESKLPYPLDDDVFANHLLAEGEYTLEITSEDEHEEYTTVLPETQRGTIEGLDLGKNPEIRIIASHTIKVPGRDKPVEVFYYMKGKYNNYTGEVQDASFDGFYANLDQDIKDAIRTIIDNNYKNTFENKGSVSYGDQTVVRQLGVNTTHQLFKQCKAAFKQELIDGIAAAKLMFKTEERTETIDGKTVTKHVIITKDGKPVLKDEWAKDTNGLSPFYHMTEDGKVFVNGKLAGKVFTSDRFVLYDEKDNVIRNYGQELIDSVVQYMTTTSVDNLIDWIEDTDEEGTLLDLNLSSEQEAAIGAKMEEFIIDFTNSSIERFNESKNFIKGTSLNINNVADFMLNHLIMYINSNELLEGDTKYYKDAQTFLKRTKEYQASGTPYAIASTRRTLTTEPKDFGEIGWGIHQKDRFNAITIRNTDTFDKILLNNLVKMLSNPKVMGDQVMSEKDAKAHIFGADGKGGYTQAVVNDAQSYITFEEWVRRVAARGELEKYRDLIDKVVNNEPFTAKDIDQFIQVQKNIYYDMYYDKNTKRVVPRQIKNAEFVLVPQFVEGTELETIYDFMRNNEIDQLNTLETSKASNNYILEVFDEDTGSLKRDVALAAEPRGNKEKTKFMKLVSKAIQPYSYNYLYEQQRTPQHLNVTNKLAIQIAKKIIDNIPEGHPLYETKQRYFKVLTTNIKESFIALMKEFNVPLDENGNIDTSDPSKFSQLDYSKINKRLREELSRVGVDDNTLDYVTLTEDPYNTGNTVMPNYFGIMINKLESITQAVINRNITRQTLAGFHAAQITNIGFSLLGTKKRIGKDKTLKYHPAYYISSTGERITEEQYNELSKEEKAKYEVRTEAYVEIALPYAAFGIDKNSDHYKNMTDEEILAELHEKGLDEFIGYRIPTEGKQSIAVMKLARFLPDGCGSTIVVPDEWVPQTGSDMDIDSVYGIQFKIYTTITGEVKKVKFINEFNENNWYNYIDKFLGGKLMTMTDEKFNSIKANAKSETKAQHKLERKTARQALQDIEQAAYDELDEGVKDVIKDIHTKTKQAYGGKKTKAQYQEALYTEYVYLNAALTGEVEGIDDEKGNLKKFSENLTEEDREKLTDYIKAISTIYNNIVSEEDNFDYSGIKSAKIKEAIDKYKEEKRATYENAAKFYGLESLEDFLAKRNVNDETILSANSKAARDNEIVRCMLDIMKSPLSLEENLARSNFDKIVNGKNGAVDLLRNETVVTKRKSRSPYNFLDEAEQQEDAMQGYALKGFSVARDTLCSVCNTVRPTISDHYAIHIKYDYSSLSKKEFNDKLEHIKNTFGSVNVDVDGRVITIKHNRLGWSNNNKNIDNEYITVYSSETTAHILDAMKSGPVPNVNKFTFGVYKTLVDVGSNYMTAVGFIMQPAVATINKYYNESNSIYADDNSVMYLHNALREYCNKLLVKSGGKALNRYESVDKFLAVVAKQYEELIKEMFGDVTLSTNYADNILPPIDQKMLHDRLLNEGEFIIKYVNEKFTKEQVLALYDLVNVLQFGKLNTLVSNIGTIQQVINPDKFGAKQSIFDAEKTFRTILRYIDRQYIPTKEGYVNNSVLSVDGVDILEVIYPGIYKGNAINIDSAIESFVSNNDNIAKSKYSSLCAHLKYGTAASVIVNRNFFPTQTPVFRKFIYKIERGFTGNNMLDEATYKDLRSYVIGALYKSCGFINTTLNWDNKNGYNYKVGDVQNQNTKEFARVYGYGHSIEFTVQSLEEELGNLPPNTKVTVEDFNKPTEDEIKLFIKLSPAQKIEFIRNRFKGESVFDYIDTRLETTINTRSARAGAQLVSFKESSADIDYIRNLFLRAFNSRNPLIALTAIDMIKYAFVVDGYRFTRNGISKIIPNTVLLNNNLKYGTSIVSDMNEMISIINDTLDDELLENYIRSNRNLRQVATKRVKKTKNGFELTKTDKGIILIPSDKAELCYQYAIMNESNTKPYNQYVRLKFDDEITLYKIHRFNDNTIVLYPLNDLERSETGVWSANENNNRYPAAVNGWNYYLDLLRDYMDSVADKSAPISSFALHDMIEKRNVKAYEGRSYNELKKDETSSEGFPIYSNTVLGNTLKEVATEIANDSTKGYGFFLNINMNYHMNRGKATNYNIPIYTKVDGKTQIGDKRPFNISNVDIAGIYDYYANPRKDRSKLNQEQLDALKFLEERISFNLISKDFGRLYKLTELHSVPDGTKEFKESGRNRVQFSTVAASTTENVNPIVKAASQIVSGVNYMGFVTGNEDIEKLQQSFRSNKITSKYNIVEQHIDDIIIPAAKALTKAVEDVEKHLTNFMEKKDVEGNFTGEYYSITDNESIAKAKTDDAMEEKYLKAVLDPGAIESKFDLFRTLDVEAEEEYLRPYIKEIKETMGRLANLPIVKKAKENYVNQILDKLSDNPEIRAGAIGVLNGMYKQNRLNALFNDIGEAPNPLVQVMMKRITDHMRAREIQARRDIQEFISHCDDIRKRAREKGVTIDNNNIFDDLGRFKRTYNDKFVEDKQKLIRTKDDAKLHWAEMAKIHGDLSVESVKAFLDYQRRQLEWDEWLAKHVEQEAFNKPNNGFVGEGDLGYYDSKNYIIREMIDHDNTKYIYAIYEILRRKRNDLRNKVNGDIENEAIDKEIEDIKNKIESLKLPTIFDYSTLESVSKDEYYDTSDDVEEMIRRAWNDKNASNKLSDFTKTMYELESKYFDYVPKFAFRQQVEENLAIIREAEQPFNGVPITPSYILARNEKYQKAKRWMRRNAQRRWVETGDSSWLSEYYSALDILSEGKEGFGVTYKNILYKKDARDENNDPNGIEISKNADNVRIVREAQNRNYGSEKENYFSDRRLINVALTDDLVYSEEYWKGITGGETKEGSTDNKLWRDTIDKINNLLAPYYTEIGTSAGVSRFIDWAELVKDYKNDEEGLIGFLESLDNLYGVLDNIPVKNKKSDNAKEFIKEHCHTIVNETRLKSDLTVANSLYKGRAQALLRRLLTSHSQSEKEANRYLYTTFTIKHAPGSAEYKKYVDVKKTEARAILKKYTHSEPTKYYSQAREEALLRDKTEKGYFRKWYLDNHVYNPYSRKFEPIAIWMHTGINTDAGSNMVHDWVPLYPQQSRQVRAGQGSIGRYDRVVDVEDLEEAKKYDEDRDFRNENYNPDGGIEENYKVGSNSEYDNPDTRNEFEKELSEYMQQTVYDLVLNKQSSENRQFVNRGWAPNRPASKAADMLGVGKALANLVGWVDNETGNGVPLHDVSYAYDRVKAMPLITLLKNADSVVNENPKPYRENFPDEVSYLKAKKKFDEREAEVKKINEDIHKAMIDKDYETVIQDFIIKANQYNAIQHSKYMFFITSELLHEYGTYMQQYGIAGDFVTDSRASERESAEYVKKIDQYMVEQFDTIIKRYVFDEWKTPYGSLTRWMNILQSVTSAKFMMLNFKGGVANVTYGEVSIHSESHAREFWNEKESIAAWHEYNSHIIDYMAHSDSDISSSETGAIIKLFDCVDYDEHNGVGHLETDLNAVREKIKKYAYSTQSAGEHALQNRALLSMLRSHRLFVNERAAEFNQPKYIYKNLFEYTQGKREMALKELLESTPVEVNTGKRSIKVTYKMYEDFVARMRADANKHKEYAWFQRDYVTEFVRSTMNWEQQSKFNEITERLKEEAEKEFYDDIEHPTMRSQLTIGSDGRWALVEGSLLKSIDVKPKGRSVTDAVQLIANFKGRVIAVNKKIHGAYDKLGRAKVENNWFGGVLMQYRKHLPIGLAKRYRSKGYFNEVRGSVEIGSYDSLIRFLSIPFKKHQNVLDLTDEEVEAGIAVQNVVKDFLDFAFHYKIAYNTLPDYDRANIRRALSDLHAMAGALFACIALKTITTGSDDDRDKWWYNFMFYQTDRLASESSQYMPWVLPQEARKTFRTPAAMFQGIDDVANTLSFLTQCMIGGDDFSPVYESGVNAGKNKLSVYIQRNIPVWRGIRSAFIDINDNNKAYKAGKNVIGFIDTDAEAERINRIFGFK